MKEPAILWEQIAIGNGIEKCISSQGSVQQTAKDIAADFR
jgi:hypothetical protein